MAPKEIIDISGIYKPGKTTEELNFLVTPELLGALDGLAQNEGLDRADIIRRALGLYARAQMEDFQGRLLAFIQINDDDDTAVVSELIKL